MHVVGVPEVWAEKDPQEAQEPPAVMYLLEDEQTHNVAELQASVLAESEHVQRV